jgi:hypothetical protein
MEMTPQTPEAVEIRPRAGYVALEPKSGRASVNVYFLSAVAKGSYVRMRDLVVVVFGQRRRSSQRLRSGWRALATNLGKR